MIGESKAAAQVGRAFLECTGELKSVDVGRRQLVRMIQSKAKGVGGEKTTTATATATATRTGTDVSSMLISSMSHDRILTHLVNLGLVVRKSVEEFYLSIPGVGALLIDIRNARKEIRRIVNRCMYKEILLKVGATCMYVCACIFVFLYACIFVFLCVCIFAFYSRCF